MAAISIFVWDAMPLYHLTPYLLFREREEIRRMGIFLSAGSKLFLALKYKNLVWFFFYKKKIMNRTIFICYIFFILSHINELVMHMDLGVLIAKDSD